MMIENCPWPGQEGARVSGRNLNKMMIVASLSICHTHTGLDEVSLLDDYKCLMRAQVFRWNFLTNSVRLSTGPRSESESTVSMEMNSSRLCSLWLPGLLMAA